MFYLLTYLLTCNAVACVDVHCSKKSVKQKEPVPAAPVAKTIAGYFRVRCSDSSVNAISLTNDGKNQFELIHQTKSNITTIAIE